MTVPNPKSVQQAIDQVASTLSNPEYKEQLTKLTQLAITNSVLTAQKLSQVSARMSKLDGDEMVNLVSNSVGDMMRLYLQFNSELLTLMQKVSIRAVDILENATANPKETQTEPTPK